MENWLSNKMVSLSVSEDLHYCSQISFRWPSLAASRKRFFSVTNIRPLSYLFHYSSLILCVLKEGCDLLPNIHLSYL